MARIEDRVETVENAVIRLSDEMRVFKDEMAAFKDEMRNDRREMNRQWGALSNKLGSIVEDLIYPALRPAVRKYFDVEPFFMGHTLRKRKEGRDYEIDALAIADKLTFVVEAKSSPKVDHVDAALEKASQFDLFYPEYAGKEIITILAAITFPEEVVKYASRNGVYVLAYREWDYMDILNFQEIERK